jgi:hypothetical protein
MKRLLGGALQTDACFMQRVFIARVRNPPLPFPFQATRHCRLQQNGADQVFPGSVAFLDRALGARRKPRRRTTPPLKFWASMAQVQSRALTASTTASAVIPNSR